MEAENDKKGSKNSQLGHVKIKEKDLSSSELSDSMEKELMNWENQELNGQQI